MKLTPAQITTLGSDMLDAAKALQAAAEKAMQALNSHNGEKGATPVNGGPLSVVRGTTTTIIEQLEKHVAENTPPAPAAAPQSPAKS